MMMYGWWFDVRLEFVYCCLFMKYMWVFGSVVMRVCCWIGMFWLIG